MLSNDYPYLVTPPCYPTPTLTSLLSQVYIPMLSVSQLKLTDGGYQQGAVATKDQDAGGDAEGERPVESRGMLMIRDELLNSAHKFLGHIDRTLQQLEGLWGCVLGCDLVGFVEVQLEMRGRFPCGSHTTQAKALTAVAQV